MIQFQTIKDKGYLEKERAVFRVIADFDIGLCMMHSVRSPSESERRLTNRVYDTYWFADTTVKEGDLVVVYTKASTAPHKIKHNEKSGKDTHFFYWGKENTVWDKKDIALIFGRFVDWIPYYIDDVELADDVEPSDDA